MSEKLSNLILRECKAGQFKDCDLVFSGLNSDIAGETGTVFTFINTSTSTSTNSGEHSDQY